MKKTSILVAILMVVALLVTGCAAPATAPATAETAESVKALPGEGETYVVIGSLFQLEFFDALKAGVCDAANAIGAKWYYAGPQEFVPDQISQAIDQAVANKVTGIVLHGQSPETAAAIDNAIAAGVPVIIVNTDIPSNRLSFLGCNPYQAGYDMGEQMGELLDGKTGKVIISTAISVGQPSALENLRGAKEALANYAGIEVVEVDDSADANVAATNIGAALQANPDVVGIIGQQAYTAVGACTAVREAGLTGKIVVIGRDRDTATLELIENGELAASYAQNSYVEGFIALQWLHDYVNGDLKVIGDYIGGGINPLPKTVDSGSVVITKDNAAQFKEKYVWEVTAGK
ncbi:MAG: substrate-binding domain-containing protein [Eubacteriales bacterium]|nr:substrate-binding domain-containing protein [Eubacteriales bacterium]